MLGLSCSYPETSGKHWTEEENNILKNNYEKPGGVALCCSLLLNRNKQNIICHARRLGLKSAKNYTPDEVDFIRQNYKTKGAKFCADQLGRTSKSITYYYNSHKL